MDMKISYFYTKEGGSMLRKSLRAVSFLALLLPAPSIAGVEYGTPVRSVLPANVSSSSSVSTIEAPAYLELARGYGWKRARKKSTAGTQEKKTNLQTADDRSLASLENMQVVRGYGWKRARKKMFA